MKLRALFLSAFVFAVPLAPVFEGPAFTQRFQDVHVEQDGPLANVSLAFVNSTPQGSSWGWKTLQLLKVNGQWKIASEFYTAHPG